MLGVSALPTHPPNSMLLEVEEGPGLLGNVG